jgi:hypothetical protein
VKKYLLYTGATILLSACVFFPHKVSITWPERVDYIEALCELDMTWNDMTYSGTMSLKMDYPRLLYIEVYGPLGNTVLSIKKEDDIFLLISKEDTIKSEYEFEKKFGITVGELMEDISMRGERKNLSSEESYIERKYYRVSYRFEKEKNIICWKGNPGVMCLTFLEAQFEKN